MLLLELIILLNLELFAHFLSFFVPQMCFWLQGVDGREHLWLEKILRDLYVAKNVLRDIHNVPGMVIFLNDPNIVD